MNKNQYINETLNLSQKICLTTLILLIILIVYFSSKNSPDTEKYIYDYENIIKSINIKQEKSLKNAEFFINSNKNIYGHLVLLKLTKIYIKNNRLNNALKLLLNNKNFSIDSNFFNLFTLKIAQIQFQKNYINEAIKTINNITDHSWSNIKSNFKKNIYFQLNNIKK